MPRTTLIIAFAAGLAGGLIAYQAALHLGGMTVVDRHSLELQRIEREELEAENRELTEELFRPRDPLFELLDESELPYDGDDDASDEVAAARDSAMQEERFLMVTFGANWCRDCRSLHRSLHSTEVEEYTADLFHFVNVDVGKFNQNRHVAEQLGVSLKRGIPVAIFFDRQGQLIGTTNEGQLEPARYYTSKQILKFMRDIAERQRILPPDAVN
ncbi:MAG: thioredoxin family protein [Gammaproteobacteria bacterium]